MLATVATGSFGTADLPASSPSHYGLDGVNFFLAVAWGAIQLPAKQSSKKVSFRAAKDLKMAV
jgi:hypothetical protein